MSYQIQMQAKRKQIDRALGLDYTTHTRQVINRLSSLEPPKGTQPSPRLTHTAPSAPAPYLSSFEVILEAAQVERTHMECSYGLDCTIRALATGTVSYTHSSIDSARGPPLRRSLEGTL